MRALLLGAVLLLAVSPQGWAGELSVHGLPSNKPRILHMPAQLPIAEHRDRSADGSANLKPFEQPAPLPPNVTYFGPIRTEIHDGHATSYIDGAHVFGGNISGSVDARSAQIILHWPGN
ncbi:MAG TPA: hypothetical protein VGT78_04870 [Rhizomicrobium sp.]|nr:hypothetical protein [Rhizomicrobium sp.]